MRILFDSISHARWARQMFVKWALTTDSWLCAHREDCGNKKNNMHKQFCILGTAVLIEVPSDFKFFILFVYVLLPGVALKGEAGHWGCGVGAEGDIINCFIWEGAQISIFNLKLLATSLFIVTCTLFTVDTITQDKGPVHAKPGFTINCK